jgi:hypothetical protein
LMAHRISIRLEVPPNDHHRLDHEHAQIQGGRSRSHRRDQVWLKSAESKSAFKTTELIVFVLSVLGVLIRCGHRQRR